MQKLPSPRITAFILTVLILLILVSSILMIFLFPAFGPREGQKMAAYIYRDGKLVCILSLTDPLPKNPFLLSGEDGSFNEIEVRNGAIGIVHASCPDKLCVHQGFRNNSLIPIVCLPNHLVIRIAPASASEKSRDPIDALTY